MSFPAKFEGDMCPAGCGYRIHAGDAVTFDPAHRLVHASCAPPPAPPPLDDVLCRVCGRTPCQC